MPDYGLDLSATTDLDPLLGTVSGSKLMGQVCLRRLYCRKGRLLSNPNAQTLDARDFVSAGINGPADLIRIQGMCSAALLGDERIQEAIVTASYDYRLKALTLTIEALGAEGPFRLTLLVTALTVDQLTPE